MNCEDSLFEIHTHSFKFRTYKDQSMRPELKVLQEKVLEAAEQAYCPYSKFQVGASVLAELEDGKQIYITGSNQENLAYPSGLCAERTALFHLGHEYKTAVIKAMAVVGKYEGKVTEECIKPCGGCRQVILESLLRQKSESFPVILVGSKVSVEVDAAALLPFSLGMLPEGFIN